MNAIQFIKLYGLHSARVTVEDAQENTHYCTETGYYSIELDVAYEPCPGCVCLSELKRLVRSVDRIDHFVDVNEMVDANVGVTVITPSGTSKVKGGMTAFVDMGDDSHIENHVSPLCKVGGEVMKSEFENSIKRSASYEKLVYQHGERLFIFDDGKYKIAAVQLAWELWEKQQSKVDELQKRVDQQGLIIAKVMSIASELQKSYAMFEIGKKLEKALKGDQ